jgi:hypothetical protein
MSERQAVNTLATARPGPPTLPTAHLIANLPLEYHGPVDFPCFGCALRSIAAYHDVLLSKNTLMFLGTLHYGYTYVHGRRFVNQLPEWRRHGFTMAIDYAARSVGIELQHLDHNAARPWAEVWEEMKAHVARDEPVYVCFKNMELLWDSIRYTIDERWASAVHQGAVAHCLVLVGYDEARGVAIFHDNHFYYENYGGVDLPYAEYRLAECERAFANRGIPAPFVFKRWRPVRPRVETMLAIQAAIVLGEKWNAVFAPPALPGVATGYAALLAAATDLAAAATGEPAAIAGLLKGFDTVLGTPWFLGVHGQPARAAWLSGVAVATGNPHVEQAAYHLDHSATRWARAKWHYDLLQRELAQASPDRQVLGSQTAALAACFREAGEHERRAGECLRQAARTLAAPAARRRVRRGVRLRARGG